MSQPVRVTLEAAKISPIPPGARSALLMQHGSMKLRYYAPRGTDAQTPHDQDELYVIASGRGTFLVGSHRVPFGPGDVLFAAAHVEHRFEGFSDPDDQAMVMAVRCPGDGCSGTYTVPFGKDMSVIDGELIAKIPDSRRL